jgi:hypothetical protein
MLKHSFLMLDQMLHSTLGLETDGSSFQSENCRLRLAFNPNRERKPIYAATGAGSR